MLLIIVLPDKDMGKFMIMDFSTVFMLDLFSYMGMLIGKMLLIEYGVWVRSMMTRN